eukprot:6602693-Prymnesium_polylepis.1
MVSVMKRIDVQEGQELMRQGDKADFFCATAGVRTAASCTGRRLAGRFEIAPPHPAAGRHCREWSLRGVPRGGGQEPRGGAARPYLRGDARARPVPFLRRARAALRQAAQGTPPPTVGDLSPPRVGRRLDLGGTSPSSDWSSTPPHPSRPPCSLQRATAARLPNVWQATVVAGSDGVVWALDRAHFRLAHASKGAGGHTLTKVLAGMPIFSSLEVAQHQARRQTEPFPRHRPRH